jgi:hypothetical protein
LKIPTTAVLVVDDVRKQIADGHVRARLELHSDPDPQTLLIAGQRVPLEREQTATLAAMLADSPVWKDELQAFFGNLALSEEGLLIALGVAANSVIPVKGEGSIESGNDGVVEYSSAHIDGVESEKVVRSDHSTQSHPETIEEVRRILLRHAASAPCDTN